MFTDFLFSDEGDMLTDLLIPDVEDVKKLLNKIDKQEELDIYDLLTLTKIKLILKIINNKKTKI